MPVVLRRFTLMLAIGLSASTQAGDDASGVEYTFDGKISRDVLENYLARSLQMACLAEKKQFDEDLRMIKSVGAKHLGRVALIWWDANCKMDIDAHFTRAKKAAGRLHQEDPEFMLQACIFETVGKGMNKIPIPDWVFEEFERKPEARGFRFEDMCYDDGFQGLGKYTSTPDISKMETKMWFYYCGRRYIDCGYENIHVGVIDAISRSDPKHENWFDTLGRLRRYAAKNARRHMVLFDAQTQNGGIVEDGKLLLDYHNMVLRPKDVIGSPEKCILEVGYGDTIWGRSAGGIAPSGWRCDHLPYQAEFDNGFSPGKKGQNIGWPYAWGSIEIDWFARQSEEFRNEWLRYAWDWIRKNDPNGYLQIPGRKSLNAQDAGGANWYRANTRSKTCPDGFNQEETIKAIWQGE